MTKATVTVQVESLFALGIFRETFDLCQAHKRAVRNVVESHRANPGTECQVCKVLAK